MVGATWIESRSSSRSYTISLSEEARCTPARPGAGHFVKLVHNAIEFGMLQAIGEGLDLLVRSDFPLDLPAVFDNWCHGSVICGWLLELMTKQLREQPLDGLSGHVEDTREVRWMVEYALEKEAWIPVIAQAELALYRYREPESVAGKEWRFSGTALAAIRFTGSRTPPAGRVPGRTN